MHFQSDEQCTGLPVHCGTTALKKTALMTPHLLTKCTQEQALGHLHLHTPPKTPRPVVHLMMGCLLLSALGAIYGSIEIWYATTSTLGALTH